MKLMSSVSRMNTGGYPYKIGGWLGTICIIEGASEKKKQLTNLPKTEIAQKLPIFCIHAQGGGGYSGI